MLSCEDVGRRLTAYLDAEVGGDERRHIEDHLAGCAPCGQRARIEAMAKRILAARAASFARPAPAELRARCAALAPRPRRSRWAVARTWWTHPGWRRTGLASASLAVAVFAVVVTYGIVSHSPSLLAAELRLDHLKCFAFFEPNAIDADPDAVAAELESNYGWRFRVPASLAREHLTLLGARRCLSTDGQMAHVLYRHAGRPVSLFVMPKTTRPEQRIDFAGRAASVWTRGRATFVLLGDESERELQPIVEHMKGSF